MQGSVSSDVLFEVYQRDWMFQQEDCSTDLRFDFVGARIDLSRLREFAQGIARDNTTVKWSIRPYKTKSDEFTITTDHVGNIVFIHLNNMTGDKKTYNKVFNIINPIVQSIPDELEDNQEDTVCAGIWYNIHSGNKAGMLNYIPLFKLLREINSIKTEKVLADLPVLCAGYRLTGEFYHTLIKLSNKKINLDAKAMTNIGTILFKLYDSPISAMMCFERALQIDPNLENARHKICIAAKTLMSRNITNRMYPWAVESGETAHKLLESILDPDFFIIHGFAYELNDMPEKARSQYMRALQIDNHNRWAQESIKRLSEVIKPQYETLKIYRNVIEKYS